MSHLLRRTDAGDPAHTRTVVVCAGYAPSYLTAPSLLSDRTIASIIPISTFADPVSSSTARPRDFIDTSTPFGTHTKPTRFATPSLDLTDPTYSVRRRFLYLSPPRPIEQVNTILLPNGDDGVLLGRVSLQVS